MSEEEGSDITCKNVRESSSSIITFHFHFVNIKLYTHKLKWVHFEFHTHSSIFYAFKNICTLPIFVHTLEKFLHIYPILSTSSPSSPTGFMLADAGYDVWLGNIRGNFYGRGHVRLTPQDDDFWDYRWVVREEEEKVRRECSTFFVHHTDLMILPVYLLPPKLAWWCWRGLHRHKAIRSTYWWSTYYAHLYCTYESSIVLWDVDWHSSSWLALPL